MIAVLAGLQTQGRTYIYGTVRHQRSPDQAGRRLRNSELSIAIINWHRRSERNQTASPTVKMAHILIGSRQQLASLR